MANVTAFAKTSKVYGHKTAMDTIIKLDTIKDKKLLKGKKSAANSAGKTTDTTKKGLQSMVTAHAEDSTYYDDTRQILYLYGKARVTYEDYELDADYIRVDEKNKIMFASGRIDPLTKSPLFQIHYGSITRPKKGRHTMRPPARMKITFREDRQKY
jgi:lipopolysaccharide assembly outer membrane protein LptD (OstA)